MPTYTLPLIKGFRLIAGIGPQNTQVLRQSLRRQHLLVEGREGYMNRASWHWSEVEFLAGRKVFDAFGVRYR